jgi:tetratricopeptide (TPR) repeat protein
MSTTSARLLASLVLTAVPLSAFAQTAAAYTPPKLLKQGTTAPATTPTGAVTIQVFVKRDGSFTVSRIIKSTNPSDNAVAMEIAKTATYKPALRDGKPVDAYYDYEMAFGGAVSLDSAPKAAGGGPTADAYALIRNGKYGEAKTELQSYLAAHPGDVQASTLLGVANAFAGDADDAAIAFDNVPSVPDQYHALAAQAYVTHSANMLAAQKYPEAVTAATHLIALEPQSPNCYYVRGLANADQQNFKEALPDLQKAYDLTKTLKQDDKSVAAIEFNLAIAELNTGAYAAAAANAKDVAQLDPLQLPKLQQAEYVAVANDAIGSANAGHIDDAVAKFEAGAATFPASAANFYGQAAFVMLTAKTPDYKKLKVEAEKSLALDPTNGRALFVNAFVAAQAGDSKGAIADMNKAKMSPLYASDASFAKQVDDNLKKLTASSS